MQKIRIYYELTSKCNLQCPYCFEKGYSSKDLSFEEISCFHKLISDNVSDIVLTGGEPFLHPDVYKIIEWFSKMGPIVVTTNGTIVDLKRIIELLSKHPQFRLQISMDSTLHDVMEKMRGKDSLTKILSLIDACTDFRSQISISATVVKTNLNSVSALIDFAKSKKIAVYFPELMPSGGLAAHWNQLMPSVEEYVDFEDNMLELIVNDSENCIYSNRIERILARYLTSESETRAIKVDAYGNIIVCPAADAGCSEAIISHISKIGDSIGLLDALNSKPGCVSANLLSDSCEQCKHNAVCRGMFCGNCIYMKTSDTSILKYICRTYFHHFENINKTEIYHG